MEQTGKFLKMANGMVRTVEKPTPFLPRNGRGDNGMKEELVKAIRENDPKIAMSNFDYAGNMTEAILLGNVAMLAGGKFKWDAKKLKTSRRMQIN